MTDDWLKSVFDDLLLHSTLTELEGKRALVAWYEKVKCEHGENNAKFALNIFTIAQSAACKLGMGLQTYIECEVLQVSGDFMNQSQKAGGNITGSAAGFGNTVAIGGDLNAFCNAIQSTPLSDELKSAITAARAEIEHANLPQNVTDGLTDALGKLSGELVKQAPVEQVAKMYWGALSAFAQQLPSIAALGVQLASNFGWMWGG